MNKIMAIIQFNQNLGAIRDKHYKAKDNLEKGRKVAGCLCSRSVENR